MMECSHHEMEMSVTPFLLPELLMQVNEMHLSCMRPQPEIRACVVSCRCLWRPSVLSLKFQRSACGRAAAVSEDECFDSLPSGASPPRWTWPVILDAVLGCIGKVKVLVTQLCLTLCNHMDCSPPGSSIHGILQARILEWVIISSSRGSCQPKDRTQVSCIAGGIVWATRETRGV